MPLISGTRVGPYEILAPLGAGGMGEVYRARDGKLNRDVAIKVLPAALANDADYVARFQREAQALAALNHPNIAAIYGLEDGAIVMELVEGQTLDERIGAGPIPVGEALRIARQIATALDAAHEKKIVHRDLKPANVKITPDGDVKVLDFGLATSPTAEPQSNSVNSPTLTMRATQIGVIMGTASYMSPEQAAGKPADKRADIFSFGVVLFEMLSGRRLFDGETISHTLAGVLMTQPDWSALPASTPGGVRRLLRRCLEKDRKNRLRDLGDAWDLLEEPEPAAAPVAGQVQQQRPSPLPWLVAGALGIVAIVLGVVAWRDVSEQAQVARLYLLPPEKAAFVQRSHPTLSPDGRRVTFVASAADTQLWVRDLDSLVARPLPGTQNPNDPFWSPDCRFIGFFADGKLKKIEAAGGPAQTVCNAPQGRGGSWNRDGVIIFTPESLSPLFRVSAAGGQATQITEFDPSQHETSHRFPWFLPDGRHFLFLTRSPGGDTNAIWAGDLESKQRKRIVGVNSNAMYAAPGLLLFVREATLMALPFDTGRLQATGDPFPVAEHVDWNSANSKAAFSLSETGVLAYFSGNSGLPATLHLFDRAGKALESIAVRGLFFNPMLSPDGGTVAIDFADSASAKRDVWLLGLARGTATRFTLDPGSSAVPVWSPDGSQVAFVGRREADRYVIAHKPSNGAGMEEIWLTSKVPPSPTSWSRDGNFLIFDQPTDQGAAGIWMLPLTGERKPSIYLQGATRGRLSADGRWIAYDSQESGHPEVFVQSFPSKSAKFQVSNSGGSHAQWSPDGREIFYIAPDRKLMAVDVKLGDQFEAGTPKALFQTRIGFNQNFSVSPEGKRFLIPSVSDEAAIVPLTVVLNWTAGLKK